VETVEKARERERNDRETSGKSREITGNNWKKLEITGNNHPKSITPSEAAIDAAAKPGNKPTPLNQATGNPMETERSRMKIQ